ncbi:PREDICTED: RANBP2-like and GRIP domain-containing protein 5/6, partial [Priapulus caudatus]|uniref:RANBP2-like and GRIP domain-containing protein 5/6 n=1 Tax=Priapulus caudatus TaxID=37621 RepID=A0ABM1F444_PRICU
MTNDKKMFRSKNDVDRHASAILSRIRNANERTLRYLNIAKLYVAVKEYETAKHYLAGFLSIQPGHAAAHKLLGQVFEASTDNEKAIESYKRSLQANSTQKDLFLKICELLCKSSVDVEKARYWLEKAEKVFHHHPILYKLKDKVLGCNAHKDPQELEQVYAVELAERPNDLGLRIRLLHLYMMTERCKDAYEHSVQVEAQQPYSHSREWYMCLAEISQAYLDKYLDGCGVDFYIHLLSILDKLVYLSLENGLEQGTAGAASLADCSDALHRFDQAAKNAFQLDGGERKDWLLFTEHMKGQLFLHAAILVMKRCQQYTKSWKESTDDSLACFLVAYSFTPLDKKSVWYARGSDLQKRFYNRCFSAACVRLSQA